MGCNSDFVYVFSKFSDSYEFAFFALLRTFLSKEPSKTLDSSMTVDFLVSTRISNILFIPGLFECFCGWRRPTMFYEGFLFAFSKVLSPVGCKTSGGWISFILRGFCFYLHLMDLKLTPSSIFFLLFFYLPIEWKEVTKRFPAVRLGVGG